MIASWGDPSILKIDYVTHHVRRHRQELVAGRGSWAASPSVLSPSNEAFGRETCADFAYLAARARFVVARETLRGCLGG